MKFMVVEDDDLLRHHIGYQLSSLEHKVYSAPDAREALYFADQYTPDAAIIDLGLPGMDGLELIRTLRDQGKNFPILILTARGNWEDKVSGLEAGADDYLVKPFRFEELKARLNALVRRSAGFSQPRIKAGPLMLDLSRKQVWCNDKSLTLTAYEYKILEYMMRHALQVVSKRQLIDELYEDEGRDSNVLEVLVGRLRKKLESEGVDNPVETVRGQGYLFTLSCS